MNISQLLTVVFQGLKSICVLRAAASMKVGNEAKNAMSFGEASPENLMGGGKKFPVAMAEKRAMHRRLEFNLTS